MTMVQKGRHIVGENRGVVNPENGIERQMCEQKKAGARIGIVMQTPAAHSFD
jgi:hypothetical protein